MAQLVTKLFGTNLRVLRLLGFYPPQKYRRLYKLYSFAVYCLFIVSIPVLASLYLITDPDIDLDKIADSAFVICQLGCFIIKMLPFLLNENEIRKSIYMIEHPAFTLYFKEQEKFMEECEKICKRITWLFLNFCIASFIGWGIIPFFEKENKLPVPVWLPYDFSSSFKLYILSFVYVVAGGGNGAISNGAIDPMVAGLAYYATTQIRILKDNLQHLSEYTERIIHSQKSQTFDVEKLKSDIIFNKIKQCVVHHNAILDFVENYEKIYSPVAFTQFAASVLVICICCFKLSQVQLFSMTFAWMVAFLFTMLSEIFLYCYFGTILLEENSTLSDAVYMGNWYEYDLKCKRALITLIERSKRPMIVTAGKILDLSLETFTTILRRAYSLLAVLKNY